MGNKSRNRQVGLPQLKTKKLLTAKEIRVKSQSKNERVIANCVFYKELISKEYIFIKLISINK